MTDHRWLELAAAYALEALAPEERTEFEAHLVTCARCRAEVQVQRDVAGLLAYAAPTPDAAPPRELRDRMLRDARRVRPIGVRRSAVPWLAAAACLVLALGLGYLYLRARGTRNGLEVALDSARSTVAARDSLIATLLSPDAASAALAATGQAPSARLFWSQSQRRVVMAVFHLQPAPAGRTYQLWAIAQGKPVSLGTFNTAADGRVVSTMALPPGLSFEVTAVTEEPAGGSPQPTQTPFLVGKVTRTD